MLCVLYMLFGLFYNPLYIIGHESEHYIESFFDSRVTNREITLFGEPLVINGSVVTSYVTLTYNTNIDPFDTTRLMEQRAQYFGNLFVWILYALALCLYVYIRVRRWNNDREFNQ